MPHLRERNVHSMFRYITGLIHGNFFTTVRTNSRAGGVIQITDPVTLAYEQPTERVLFNQARDANPFFHVVESLWMLAGRNDVALLDSYSSNYSKITSDDGLTANGAYGYRWRHASYEAHLDGSTERCDQLQVIINHLKTKPESRRAVLQMWNVEDDLLKIDDTKDVCCNLSVMFSLRRTWPEKDEPGEDTFLDMTVTNRSNDFVWGALGANAVHFSFLQEYMAKALGVEVGKYHQFTNNLHVYTERWEPEKYLADSTPNHYTITRLNRVPLVKDVAQFDKELPAFLSTWCGRNYLEAYVTTKELCGCQEPFLKTVAFPMVVAYWFHKKRQYGSALQWASEIMADDWRIACTDWLLKRKANWDNRTDNPYLKNEEQRIMEEAGAASPNQS
jgi:thymidylate synthase